MAEGRRADIASGAVLAGLGIYIIMESRQWSYSSPDGPGPGMFPMWYGIAMLVLSLVLVALALMRKTGPGKPVDWRGIGNALTAWAAFTLGIALLKPLGFVLGFGLLTFFVAAISYKKPLGKSLAAAVGSALGFYLVFPLALDVPLPVGPLGF
jgi:putative tricarboxylic transport membrane protein